MTGTLQGYGPAGISYAETAATKRCCPDRVQSRG